MNGNLTRRCWLSESASEFSGKENYHAERMDSDPTLPQSNISGSVNQVFMLASPRARFGPEFEDVYNLAQYKA